MAKPVVAHPALLKRPVLVYTILLLYTVGPIVSMLAASAVAARFGCRLDEGSVHTCVVVGVDLGGTLYFMAVSAWFALVTLPSGGLALIGYTVALVVFLIVRRKAPPAS